MRSPPLPSEVAARGRRWLVGPIPPHVGRHNACRTCLCPSHGRMIRLPADGECAPLEDLTAEFRMRTQANAKLQATKWMLQEGYQYFSNVD
ncbi:hypothetical protein GUJ93_ZPchr0010g9304 [Zizania palustris]|uniref:Uncharacterized protein n=1 Tax=Zizania palustris TaxID=103762 RepID=A0A8J5TMB4_ZIZPA|nr:hypothetical protein GUJ93_ZPchr0010g9304 [Zizania palustris]